MKYYIKAFASYWFYSAIDNDSKLKMKMKKAKVNWKFRTHTNSSIILYKKKKTFTFHWAPSNTQTKIVIKFNVYNSKKI